jgi:hypothetical protein
VIRTVVSCDAMAGAHVAHGAQVMSEPDEASAVFWQRLQRAGWSWNRQGHYCPEHPLPQPERAGEPS